jgi:uncharacterized protein (TIGR03067 family)
VVLAAVTFGFAGAMVHAAWAGKSSRFSETPMAAEAPGKEKGTPGKKKPDSAKDAAARELKAFQGDWKVVGLETEGKKATAEDVKGMRWRFTGSVLIPLDPSAKPGDKGEIKLDPSKDPKQIDIVSLEGTSKGTTIRGIYKWEDGRLIICMSGERDSKKGRPDDFTIEDGRDQGIITLESVKNPPKTPIKSKPRSEKVEIDPMEGKRWIVKGPDTLQLVGASGPIGSPVKVPRFRLEPGQELTYAGEIRSSGDRGSRIRIRGERQIWVVRANEKGGWRVVLRSATIIPRGTFGNPEHKRVTFEWCDLFPEGRLVELNSSVLQTDARYLLARLPADAASAARGWESREERSGGTYRYRLLPPVKPGQCVVEAVRESDLDVATGMTIKSIFTWNGERGIPESVQLEAVYSDGRRESATLKLGESKTHDPAWCREMAADADRYFAADSAYHDVLSRQGETPARRKATLEKGAVGLKAARAGLNRPEFRERVDTLLAEHQQQARALFEEAERRMAILGKPAPEWSTTDLEGKPHALKDYRGKVVILDFWYRSCLWCVRAMPQVKEIAARFKDRPVVVLGMNTDTRKEDAQMVAKKMGLTYANLEAKGLPEKYQVQGYPTLVIIDQQGVVRDIHVGYSPMLKEEVSKTVERLLKDRR